MILDIPCECVGAHGRAPLHYGTQQRTASRELEARGKLETLEYRFGGSEGNIFQDPEDELAAL